MKGKERLEREGHESAGAAKCAKGSVRERVGRWPATRVCVKRTTVWNAKVHVRRVPLEELIAQEFVWQPGWEYILTGS